MLDFRLSEEQSQIVSAVAHTLERDSERFGEQGHVAHIGELGWLGIALPEECGGSGGTAVEGALVAFEFGRALASPDLLGTQLAGLLASSAGDLDLSRAFASGERSAGFCLASSGSESAGREATDYLLSTDTVSGYLRVRGHLCDIVKPPTEVLDARECIDPGVRLHRGRAESGEVLVQLPDPEGAFAQSAVILLSAMLAGIADSSRDLAVAYTKTRKQFGRFIGEFQAIKHHCANMHLRARAAYAQTMHAAMLTAAKLPGAEIQAMAAWEVSANAAVENGEMGVHIHGGMGFSEECSAHRYLKRAHLLRIIGSDLVAGLPTPFERLASSLDTSPDRCEE